MKTDCFSFVTEYGEYLASMPLTSVGYTRQRVTKLEAIYQNNWKLSRTSAKKWICDLHLALKIWDRLSIAWNSLTLSFLRRSQNLFDFKSKNTPYCIFSNPTDDFTNKYTNEDIDIFKNNSSHKSEIIVFIFSRVPDKIRNRPVFFASINAKHLWY